MIGFSYPGSLRKQLHPFDKEDIKASWADPLQDINGVLHVTVGNLSKGTSAGPEF